MFVRALLSVSDKSGLERLTQGLAKIAPECDILSTGGTSSRLSELGIACREVADYTGFPECFSGRVKTLHPKIHGGILYRRGQDDEQAHKVGILPIDLVVVNLYPFQSAFLSGSEDLAERIDIGGPALLRAAAKNCESVVVLCDPTDYPEFLERAETGRIEQTYRRYLQAKVFAHTAAYDASIAAALSEESYPEQLTLSFRRKNNLRYGENPHQTAAVYEQDFGPTSLAGYTLHHGRELSYNNLLDSAASQLPFYQSKIPMCCVVKHAAPCSLAQAQDNTTAFKMAWAGDPVSAFGSVVSFSHGVERAEAELLSQNFVEVVVAPEFSAEALAVLRKKPALRLVEIRPNECKRPNSYRHNMILQDGLALCQQADRLQDLQQTLVTETPRGQPDKALLLFALNAVRCLKSNAICLAARVGENFQTLGMGGGQPNRVQALKIAIDNATENFGKKALKTAVLASDAFFPFPDSIEVAAAAGIGYIVSPSGSKKDGEVRNTAQRLGVSLVFVDHRLFRH